MANKYTLLINRYPKGSGAVGLTRLRHYPHYCTIVIDRSYPTADNDSFLLSTIRSGYNTINFLVSADIVRYPHDNKYYKQAKIRDLGKSV